MAQRKLSKTNIRKLTRVGGTSLAVTISIQYLPQLKWQERQKVVVKKKSSSKEKR